VDAFVTAVREGNFERLVAILDPDVVLRGGGGAPEGASRVVRGAEAVAKGAVRFSKYELAVEFVLVNGNLGFVTRRPDGRLFSVVGFTISSGKIVEIDILTDPERLSRLDLSAIES
jgi:RNA polymerase sigma-70 factor (ECF subfamily)